MPLHTRQLGTGPDLVLVHGWALSLEVWEPVIESLAEDFRLTLVDLPGHGGSPMQGRFTVDTTVDLLVSVIPQGSVLLGWSLGGMMALALAARFPARISKLVLVAGNSCFVSTADRPLGMAPEVLTQLGTDLTKNYRDTIAKFLAASTLGAKDGPALLRRLIRHLSTAPEPDINALRDGLEVLRTVDLRPQLPYVSCPTLIILGERDMLVPVAVGNEYMQALADPRLEIIPGAGHAPFLSHPEQFVQLIKDFSL